MPIVESVHEPGGDGKLQVAERSGPLGFLTLLVSRSSQRAAIASECPQHLCRSSEGHVLIRFILDLKSFGVPNHRTRYYLLAERLTWHLQIPAPPTTRFALGGDKAVPTTGCPLT